MEIMKSPSTIGFRRALIASLSASAMLLFAPRAQAYIYWANWDGNAGTTIGRATVDGGQVDQSFITGAHGPCGVAVDGKHIYWGNQLSNTVGRANIDGSGVDQNFITGITGASDPCSVAVDSGHVYWDESNTKIGRANLNGTDIQRDFITGATTVFGLSVDSAHLYWANSGANSIGRANLDGTGVNQGFIPNAIQDSMPHEPSYPVVSPTSIYYAASENTRILRTNLDGTGVQQNFITGARDAALALDSRYLFWSDETDMEIGRSNLDGTAVSDNLVQGAIRPLGVAVDSNSFTLGKLKRKKNGTATLFADVPGPGQVGLQGKGIAQIAVTASARESLATAGGSVKLKIGPAKGKKGRSLRGRLANRGKAKVKATITFVPSGGDPNTLTRKVKLARR